MRAAIASAIAPRKSYRRVGERLRCLAAAALAEAWGLLVTIPVYLTFGLLHASLPGPYGDEVLQAAPAGRIATGNLPDVPIDGPAIVGGNLVLLHRVLPFVELWYLGPVKTYYLAAAFALFGVDVAIMRAATLFAGLMGLLALYFYARLAFNRPTANIVVILIGLDPSFVIFARDDWGPTTIGFTLKVLGLYAVARWWRAPGSRLVPFLAGLAFGAGMSHKADFAWIVLAMAPVGVLLYLPEMRLRARSAGIGLLTFGFLLGSGPLLSFNLASGWSTWTSPGASLLQAISQSSTGQSAGLAMIHLLLASVPVRWAVLSYVLDGRGVMNYVVGTTPSGLATAMRGVLAGLGLDSASTDTVARLKLTAEEALGLVSLASVVVVAFRRRSWPVARPAVASVLVTLLIISMIAVTPSASGPHHAVTIYPFPQLVVAYALSLLPLSIAIPRMTGLRDHQRSPGASERPPVRWSWIAAGLFGAALTLVVVASDVGQLLSFERRLVQTGGDRFWSNAIVDAARFIQTRHGGEYVQTLDWGQRDQLTILLGPAVPVGFWTAEDTPGADLASQVRANHHVFVSHVEGNTLFKDVRQRFLRQLASLDLGPVQEHVFSGTDGLPNVVVVEVPWRSQRSLLANLNTAKIVPPRGDVPPIGIHDVRIGGIPHHSLLQHPASRVGFPLRVPTAGRLEFSIGIDPQCQPTSTGADFAVEVDDGTVSATTFERTMQPMVYASDRAWNDERVDLGPWQGRQVTLSFVTKPVGGQFSCAWALWGDPTIASYTLQESSPTPAQR